MKNGKVKPTYLKETSLSATHAKCNALKAKLCPPQREAGDYPRGVFRPRQTRQLSRAVDLKGRLLSCRSY